jgi:16S rRNA (guanine966-N2)-methyltransferase
VRIVAGKFRGRTIHAPQGQATRPTTDRVREAIFNRLEHGVPGLQLDGARVLDLFAGTGALGLEALSRGARNVLFIDDSETARGLIRRNADELGVIGQVKLWRRDAAKLGPCAPMSPFGLVFMDPPYGKGLAKWRSQRWCPANGLNRTPLSWSRNQAPQTFRCRTHSKPSMTRAMATRAC